MNNTGFDMAARAFVRAHESYKLMFSKNLIEVEYAWEDFLNQSSRLYEKLRETSRGNAKLWRWYTLKLDERRDDQLLCYLHHARNSDHHGISEMTELKENLLHIRPPQGGTLIEKIEFDGGNVNIKIADGYEPPKLRFFHHSLNLMPVWDRDATRRNQKHEFAVPSQHLGKPIIATTGQEVAEFAIKYFKSTLDELYSLIR